MRKVNMLPPDEIYDVLHEAEAADIAIPPIVGKWWKEETALNVGAQPPQADNNRSDEIALLEAALSCMPAFWSNTYGDSVRQRINVRIAQLRAMR